MRRKILCVIGAGLLMVLIGSCSQDKTTAAKGAAESWLKLVDSGNYAQSWDQAANLMKTSVAKEQWEQILD